MESSPVVFEASADTSRTSGPVRRAGAAPLRRFCPYARQFTRPTFRPSPLAQSVSAGRSEPEEDAEAGRGAEGTPGPAGSRTEEATPFDARDCDSPQTVSLGFERAPSQRRSCTCPRTASFPARQRRSRTASARRRPAQHRGARMVPADVVSEVRRELKREEEVETIRYLQQSCTVQCEMRELERRARDEGSDSLMALQRFRLEPVEAHGRRKGLVIRPHDVPEEDEWSNEAAVGSEVVDAEDDAQPETQTEWDEVEIDEAELDEEIYGALDELDAKEAADETPSFVGPTAYCEGPSAELSDLPPLPISSMEVAEGVEDFFSSPEHQDASFEPAGVDTSATALEPALASFFHPATLALLPVSFLEAFDPTCLSMLVDALGVPPTTEDGQHINPALIQTLARFSEPESFATAAATYIRPFADCGIMTAVF